ncbi:hypothetical protein AB0J47_28890 [Nocardia sp. NPDC049737]|uniref:hypothetical protein n=1 Tax=Nocardia sp. NPDC049737 TaxID=3154358 RepID=UPI00342BDAC2
MDTAVLVARGGDPSRGPWPTSTVERFEPIAAKRAEEWPVWGHRKIAALMRADGYEVVHVDSGEGAAASRAAAAAEISRRPQVVGHVAAQGVP